ncbi:MAG: hypothetical protein ACTSUO_09300 [Candidatus Thorarchaeota archaeon]
MNWVILFVFIIISLVFIITAVRDWNRLIKYGLEKLEGYDKSREVYLRYRENPARWTLSVRLRFLIGFALGAISRSFGPNDEFLLPIFIILSALGVIFAIMVRPSVLNIPDSEELK